MATRRQTRLASVNNVALNHKKVHFVDNVRVSLIKCDAMNLKSSLKKKVPYIKHSNNTRATRNSSKTNVSEVSSKTSSPRKRKSLSPREVAPKRSKAKSLTKTNPQSEPSQNSPKKKKLGSDSSPSKSSKTPIGAEVARPKSPVKLKSPTKNATKEKGNKIKAQMKLGRIFVKSDFPVKSILKKNINAEDNQEKHGQSTTAEKEANNVVKRLQPKILLRKIDHRKQRNVSPVRHVHETRRALRSNR